MKHHFTRLLIAGFMLLVSGHLYAQAQDISGTVTDGATGEQLPGVSVSVKGTSNGVITDSKGSFKLKVNPTDVLRFSFIGYNSHDEPVGNRTSLSINLLPDIATLEEVVVLGYVTVKRGEVTGSVSSINNKEIEKANTNNVLSVIQGRTPGVQIVSNDGSPGGGFTLNIRGTNSINAGTSPLVVIDGVPFVPPTNEGFNPLSVINPNDIESIDILKDAAATALYGAEAAAGVFIITTKKGKKGAPQLNVSYTGGVSYIPDNRTPKMQSAEAFVYSMYDRVAARPPQQSLGGGNPWLNRIEQQYWQTGATNWLKAITTNPTTHNFNADYSAATDKTNYRVSFGYNDEKGVVINSGFKRFSSKVNVDQAFGKRVNIGVSLQYAYTKYEGLYNAWGGFGGQGLVSRALFSNPFIPINDAFGASLDDDTEFTFSGGVGGGQRQNPLTYINDLQFDRSSNYILGNTNLRINVTKDLTFTNSLGVQLEKKDLNRFVPNTTREGQSSNGILNVGTYQDFNYVFISKLGYRKNINKVFTVTLDAIFEAKKYAVDNQDQQVTNIQVPSLKYYSGATTGTPSAPLRTLNSFSTASGLFRAALTYKDKYILNGSIRSDASSKFGVNNKTAFFPSVSFAWIPTKEKFIENLNLNWLENVKIRGGYGIVGNNQIATYLPYSTLEILAVSGTQNRYVFYNGTTPVSSIALGAARLANPDLKWETTTSYDIGTDIDFLHGRMSFTFDYYYKKTTDLLLEVDLPRYYGTADRVIRNKGSLENQGLEFSLNGTAIKKQNFSWDVGFNISFNRNKILSLGDNYQLFFNRIANNQDVLVQIGDPIGQFFGLINNGVYNTDIERYNSPIDGPQANKALGTNRYLDLNGDGTVTLDDRTVVGNTLPVHTGGITTTLTYKNFELYVFGRWSYGNDVVNQNSDQATEARYDNLILAAVDGKQWTPQKPDNNYFGIINSNRDNIRAFRSEYIEDGSFFRLDRLSLSYSVPSALLTRYKIRTLRLNITGSNLWVLTRYSWFDPEVNTGFGTAARLGPGVDASAYPRMRNISAGLTLGF